MNFHGYSIRMTTDKDTTMVQTMLLPKMPQLEKIFGKIDIPKICETSLYSLVAFSTSNTMVAFAAFDDNPMATIPPGFPKELSEKAGCWAVQGALDLGYRREMLLWTTLCANVVVGVEEELTLHKAMLSSVLVLSHDTMVILQSSSFEFGSIPGLLKPIAHYQKQDFKLSVCACRRSFLFPKLFMRRAREEDQDDLTPVIEHAQQRGLPLTQVPETACPSKPYAIARLIAAQNKQNSVFVAQVNKKIMGVIAITSDVHLPSLHENYDLDCFEGLMAKTIVQKFTVVAKKEVDPFAFDPFAPAISETKTKITKEEEVLEVPKIETFTRWPENAFRVAMLCMEVEYESRAIDVIDFAFSKLNKELCLVTLPYVSPDHPLLHFFYRVPTRLGACNKDKELSADTRCLYLLHVDALSPGFAVRPLKPDDASSLGELLDTFADKDKILDSAFNALEERLNMVVVLSNQVVGFAILDNTAPVAEIASHFDLQLILNLEHHPFQDHASIVLYVLNPVYRYRSRFFFQEIMRQTGKSIIYCPIFPLMELPDILEDLILVQGRQHAHLAPPCYWTMPKPEEDKGENVSIEGSPSKTTTTKSTIDPSKSLNYVKKDFKTLDLYANSSHEKDHGSNATFDKNYISNNNQKPLGVHVKDGLQDIDATTFGGKKQGFSQKEKKMENEFACSKNPTESQTKGVPQGSKTSSTPNGQQNTISIDSSSTQSTNGNTSDPHVGQQKNDESDGLKTQDLAKHDPLNNTKLGACKAQDISDEASQEHIAKCDVSAQGDPIKSIFVKDIMKESTLGEVGEKEDTPNVESKDIAAIEEERSDAIKDDQNEILPSEGDTSSIANSTTMETEVPSTCPPIQRGYFHGFDCALYVLTHKCLYRYKTIINARIVVVGSSITTAGFLHKLLTSQELQFTNLIMVSNAGFKHLSSTSLASLTANLGPKHSFPKLGLDCQVKIIKALVNGINRKDCTIQLSTGKDIPYDWLVLSSGLQDQTKQRLQDLFEVKGGVIKADELVLKASEFAKQLTACASKSKPIAPVVIYGATLDAFGAIQALLQEGLDGKNLLLVHPEIVNIETTATKSLGDTETSQMILASLIQAGLSIHSGLKLVGAETNASTGWINALQFQDLVKEDDLDGMSWVPTSLENLAKKSLKSVEALEEVLKAGKCPIHKVPMGGREALKSIHVVDTTDIPERKLKVPCSMLVTSNKPEVDLPLFQAIHKEALIFDGRIVVDGYFQTNDPLIFAAGSLCKFSRHCGDNLPKCEAFCPWEVGEALAPAVKAVIVTAIYGPRTRCASEEYVEILKPHKWPRPNLPSLKKPRCIGGLLPGEQWFFSATAPKLCMPLAGTPAMSLKSRTADSYCRLDIMDNKEIGRIIYFGKARLEEWKLVCFVGLPDTLIHDLVRRWENNQVPDIAEFLLRPWATVIFHDKFPGFFQNLSEEVRAVMKNSRTSMTVFLTELAGGKIKSLEPQLMKQSGDIVHMKLMRFLKEHKIHFVAQ